jgi:hypothetical protein
MNDSRSLIFNKHHKSLLISSLLDQYFYNQPWIKESYYTSTKAPCSNKCGIIGLHIGSDDWAYPIWVIAKGMNGRMPRIEHLQVNNVSASIPLVDFKPCAVLESSDDKKLDVKFDSTLY